MQLLARFILGIIFVLLQTKVLYPLSFPSNFNCKLTRDGKFSDIAASSSHNVTQTQTSYECHNQRAAKKAFWAHAVIVVTGTFAFLVFIESLYLISRLKKVERFKEDPKFLEHYLSSNKPTPLKKEQGKKLELIIFNFDDDHAELSSTVPLVVHVSINPSTPTPSPTLPETQQGP